MKKLLCVLLVSLACSSGVQAAIIETVFVDSALHTAASPLMTTLLPAGGGLFLVTPIDPTSPGGNDGAWNAWGGQVNLPNRGWLNDYWLETVADGIVKKGDSSIHATEELAFADASSHIITVGAGEQAKLWIQDFPITDNIGGVTLQISDFVPSIIPAPSAILLGGLGTAAVSYLRRRKLMA